MKFKNLPIAYDFHGDKPFTVPFASLKPSDIHVYLDLDTKVGKNTCEQNCAHCWFVNYEKVFNKTFGMHEGKAIKDDLDRAGFKVFARYVDSFAHGGEFMKVFGPAHNREFRQEHDHIPTDTMKKGDAWSSGRPLLGANYRELLKVADEAGYGTISITYHGLIDENLEVGDHTQYPIKGTFPGKSLEAVAARITEFNRTEGKEFRLNIGVTIGRHNSSREMLTRYVHYFNRLGVATVRFNNFTDHGDRHPHLQLSNDEVRQLYKDIKWLHESLELKFQLAVSEDLGSFGIEVMGFPAQVGQCQAGRQLFTVIPCEHKSLTAEGNTLRMKIGDIVGCVNIFEPLLGKLVRTVNEDGGTSYALEFDVEAIESFTKQRLDGTYKNGCFAKELRLVTPPQLTAVAKAAVAKRLAEAEEGA